MATRQNFVIAGTAGYTPSKSITAEEIDLRIGEQPGWTRAHVGVETRYECKAPETMLTMSKHVIQTALDRASITWSNVDLLIDCSTTRCRPIPCNAAHHLALFGEETRGIAGFDIQSTCLGFLLALNTANALFSTGAYRHIVLVASECAMEGINWQQPESAALIGDGAAAVVLRASEQFGTVVMHHQVYGEHLETCRIDGGAHNLLPFEYSDKRRAEYSFNMNGPAVFRAAISKLPRMVRTVVEEWSSSERRSLDAVKEIHVIPHQASPRALEAVQALLATSPERFHSCVRHTGNMAAASLPFMLNWCLENKRIPAGSPCMLLGTSAGYAQAAMIFTLEMSPC